MNFCENKMILITGGAGFLGSHLVEELQGRGVAASNLRIPRSRVTDLRKRESCEHAMAGQDIVIHLAGNVGGIGFNRENPASLFYDLVVSSSAIKIQIKRKIMACGTSISGSGSILKRR